MRKIVTKKRLLAGLVILLLLIAGVIFYAHRSFYAVPQSRLAAGAVYPEMPEDDFHHYIDLPLDHLHPERGTFRAFYQFGPNFYRSRPVTFLLTDGQMELVGLQTDFDFFEDVLPGVAYVLVGVRGQSPTLFPEVFKDGKIDYEAALDLYGSDQQIEDIEAVRRQLVAGGILKPGEKINVFGASGAGVLAQQYVSKYGTNVERLLLESTGAPDLARQNGSRYSPDFKDFNPEAAPIFDSLVAQKTVDKRELANVLYQLGRTEKEPRAAQTALLESLRDGGNLWRYRLKPPMNLSILNYVIKSPSELAARVRWFELVGADLLRYDGACETNLLYEISSEAVSDLLDFHRRANRPAKEFVIDRQNFAGEVLILKGTEDVVFSDDIARSLEKAYPHAKALFFKDGHRMLNDKERYRQIRKNFLDIGFRISDQ
ncbi:MAG: hypothetical protein JSS81_27005 [Acidobacteria bacterium]|nr:hypothetical protein [Acidobacteriota bacterium]